MSWSPSWLVAADKVHLDALTRCMSVMDVLDHTFVARVPCTRQGFALCARFARTEGLDAEGAIHVRIERAAGTEDWELVKETEAAFMTGQPTAYAHVSFRALRVLDFHPIDFRIRWRVGGKRWRKGPHHRIVVHPHPHATAMVERLDGLPPLG